MTLKQTEDGPIGGTDQTSDGWQDAESDESDTGTDVETVNDTDTVHMIAHETETMDSAGNLTPAGSDLDLRDSDVQTLNHEDIGDDETYPAYEEQVTQHDDNPTTDVSHITENVDAWGNGSEGDVENISETPNFNATLHEVGRSSDEDGMAQIGGTLGADQSQTGP